jgi:hypothetical protein
METVWVFVGAEARNPSAIFTTRSKAQTWIERNSLSGLLTEYPLDVPVIDWAIREHVYSPRPEDEEDPWIIATFTSAAQRHYHFVDGELA